MIKYKPIDTIVNVDMCSFKKTYVFNVFVKYNNFSLLQKLVVAAKLGAEAQWEQLVELLFLLEVIRKHESGSLKMKIIRSLVYHFYQTRLILFGTERFATSEIY